MARTPKKKAAQVDWIDTPEGIAAYRAKRAEAQAWANQTGFDVGMRVNRLFKEWSFFGLPDAVNRYGDELSCEVVMCEDISKTQPGHGSAGKLALRERDAHTYLHRKQFCRG